MTTLVLNAGSSSIKFAMIDTSGNTHQHGQIGGIGSTPFIEISDLETPPEIAGLNDHGAALAYLFEWIDTQNIKAVGHRVVHGGMYYDKPVLVDAKVMSDLSKIEDLAPHHQPHNIAAMRAVANLWPNLPQVACFDTAFHASMPWVARETGLPKRYTMDGIRRYGFHGLSYDYVTRSLSELCDDGQLPSKLIAFHLGNGASLCAIKDGRSIASTMGYTALDGIPMATRSGAVDPGALIAVMRRDALDVDGLENLLYNQCGVLGMSNGLSVDMKALLDSTSTAAKQAVDFYCYRIAREAGSLAVALGGVDVLAFTGGIGANASVIRDKVCQQLAWLKPDGTLPVYAIQSGEEAIIASYTQALVS